MVITESHQDIPISQFVVIPISPKIGHNVLKAATAAQWCKCRELRQHGQMAVWIDKRWHQSFAIQADLVHRLLTKSLGFFQSARILDNTFLLQKCFRRIRFLAHGDDIATII